MDDKSGQIGLYFWISITRVSIRFITEIVQRVCPIVIRAKSINL